MQNDNAIGRINHTYVHVRNVTSYFYRNLTCENRQGSEYLLRTPLPLYPGTSLYRYRHNATSVKDQRVDNLHHEIFQRVLIKYACDELESNRLVFDNTMLSCKNPSTWGTRTNSSQ